ncbi:MAG: TylF/MycF/NovP-related O-methyltransferase [Patescibacteria group bacterium]
MAKKRLLPNTLPLRASSSEVAAYQTLAAAWHDLPIPSGEILANASLFLTRSSTAHLLFLDDLYRRILSTPGQIFEFGVRWGRNLAAFHTLRTIYEPFNTARHIVGFDTFEGFPNVAPKDGKHPTVHEGALSVAKNHEDRLALILEAHQNLGPRGHLKRFDLVKGDVTKTLPRHLRSHPEAIVALAYFDMDLYKPTRACLKALRARLTKGSVLVFDQLGLPEFPGETSAVLDELGAANLRLQRDPRGAHQAFVVLE